MTAAALLLSLLLGPVLALPGCGESPRFDKAAEYSPESLTQELVFRFNALSPAGKTATRSRKPQKGPVGSKADELSTTKSQSKAAAKKELPRTVDDVLDDIAVKAGLIKGMARGAVFARMAEAISSDTAVPENDRKMLAEKLMEMSGG